MDYTTGWQCPVCHHVFAPYIEECPYCIVQNVGAYTPHVTPDDLTNERRIEMAKEKEAFCKEPRTFTGHLDHNEDEARLSFGENTD